MGQIFTFCLATLHHGIHITLLHSIKGKWNTLRGRQNPPNNQTNTFDQLVNQINYWTSKLFRKSQFTFCNKLSKSSCWQANISNGEFPFGLTLFIFLEPRQTFPIIQTKIMGSFHIIVRASRNIFTIFGNIKMSQLNIFWKINKLPYLNPMSKGDAKLFISQNQIWWSLYRTWGGCTNFCGIYKNV